MRYIVHGNILFISVLLLFVSCRHELSKEQKEQMKEARKQKEITRMTDQDIVQAALETGRMFRNALEQNKPVDSLKSEFEAIVLLHLDSASMTRLETEIWTAYRTGWENKQAIDENVQRDYPDFLYYTYPLIQNDSLKGMASIRLSRKQIILHQ